MEEYTTGLTLDELAQSKNICDSLSDSDLGKIGARVCRDFQVDADSMDDWRDRNDTAFRLIEHSFEKKSEPWDNAANAKIPLVLNAAVKFQSEAGAEIVKGSEIVKFEIFGKETDDKIDRAKRVQGHMNYQLFHEMENWEGDMDQLLLVLPLIGCMHKKVYFCPVRMQNVSELCLDNITINNSAVSVKSARVTQEFERDKNSIHSNEVLGLWRKIEYTTPNSDDKPEDDGEHKFLEQHRRLDLDGDGYEEPYIVTVEKESEQPVRIVANFKREDVFEVNGRVARIEPNCKFIKFGFIPAPDGGYWDYGWGILLGPLNDNVNTLVNQLLDAGTLANTGGGWRSTSLRISAGDQKFKPGEWKAARAPGGVLKDAFFPLPVREPSQTLFALLGLLIEQAKEFTSVTDVISGEQPQANMAATSVLALIEQGKKTFNAIYKRIYRGLKAEFKKLYDLNLSYTDPMFYRAFHDGDYDFREDYEDHRWDIIPTANPEFSSKVQRMAIAQSLLAVEQSPYVNSQEVMRIYVQSLEVPNVDAIVPESPLKTPEMMIQEMEQLKQEILASNDVQKSELDKQIRELDLQIKQMEARAKGVELPFKVEVAMHKADEAESKAEKAKIEARMSDEEILGALGLARS